MEDLIKKARTLIEALPYIRAFHDKIVVIKYGGAAMVESDLKSSFASDVTLLRFIGIRPVIVHGGGPQIGEMLKRVGKKTSFVDGMRVTDDEAMEIVEMVLGGKVNAEIVERIGRAGGQAVGLTGKDGSFLRVTRLTGQNGEDLGWVGTPEHIDADIILRMTDAGFIPVIAPIGIDADGRTYNVNADLVAGRLAEAIGAEKLILLTDVDGVLDADGKMMPRLDAQQARAAIRAGDIKGGMIPKVDCCIHAREGGVTSAHIIDGRVMHALLLEIFTDGGVGTLIGGGA